MNVQNDAEELPRPIRVLGDVVAVTVRLAIRLTALLVFLLMSLAEPFLAVALCGLALASFAVTVLFGFILGLPFPHRWLMLGISAALLGAYLVYRFLMLGVQRLLA